MKMPKNTCQRSFLYFASASGPLCSGLKAGGFKKFHMVYYNSWFSYVYGCKCSKIIYYNI